MIERQINVEVNPTAEELAESFWAMDSNSQVAFFNHLGQTAGYKLRLQLQFVTEKPELTAKGRAAMNTIGEYAGASEGCK